VCALDDPAPLDLSEDAHDAEHLPTYRRREIERLAERHEADAEVL